MRLAGLPCLPRPLESAIEKQLACAAARSSSGVVWLAAPSVRAFQLRFASLNVPLWALMRPLPDIRSPSHDAVARLSIALLLVGSALLQLPAAIETALQALGHFSRAASARRAIHRSCWVC